jgi:hypothetical protein
MKKTCLYCVCEWVFGMSCCLCRNGILSELELLIRRDRNHPSVVIWSLCNEKLCLTSDWVSDALAAKAYIRELDPLGGRLVSANENGWIGPSG